MTLFIGVGCGIPEPTIDKKLGETFELPKGQSVRLKDANIEVFYKDYKRTTQTCTGDFFCSGGDRYFVIKVNSSRLRMFNESIVPEKYKEYYIYKDRDSVEKMVKLTIFKKGECESIVTDWSAKADCLIERGDYDNCLSINNENGRYICINDYVSKPEVAYKKDDEKILQLCAKIGDAKLVKMCNDNYFKVQAVTTQDRSICKKFTNSYAQDDCIESISNSERWDGCVKFKNVSKQDDCYLDVVKEGGRKMSCGQIVNESKRNKCFKIKPKGESFFSKFSLTEIIDEIKSRFVDE